MIDAVRNYFREMTPVFYFSALPPNDGKQAQHIKTLEQEGYTIELGRILQFKFAGGTESKRVDGIESLFVLRVSTLPKEIDTVVLITGDSDFVSLIEHLQQIQKKIILITEPDARDLRKAFKSETINLKSFINNLYSGTNPFFDIRRQSFTSGS